MSVRRRTAWRVKRPTVTDDGAGGSIPTMVDAGTVRGDVRELVGRERIEAMQAGAEHTHTGWFPLRTDIRRNDELHGTQTLEVLTVSETFPPTRLRVTARSIEAGG